MEVGVRRDLDYLDVPSYLVERSRLHLLLQVLQEKEKGMSMEVFCHHLTKWATERWAAHRQASNLPGRKLSASSPDRKNSRKNSNTSNSNRNSISPSVWDGRISFAVVEMLLVKSGIDRHRLRSLGLQSVFDDPALRGLSTSVSASSPAASLLDPSRRVDRSRFPLLFPLVCTVICVICCSEQRTRSEEQSSPDLEAPPLESEGEMWKLTFLSQKLFAFLHTVVASLQVLDTSALLRVLVPEPDHTERLCGK